MTTESMSRRRRAVLVGCDPVGELRVQNLGAVGGGEVVAGVEQPAGRRREDKGIVHPGIAGRQAEMADLSDAVRRWIALAVSNRAPAGEAAAAAAALHALADGFDRHVPDPPPPTTYLPEDEERGQDGPDVLAERLAYDFVIGRYSPLALPLTLSFEPPLAIARGRFTLPYEGPPGCVHGAVLAACFDIVLTGANLIAGAGGPTVRLSARYRRPTRLHDEVVLEGWVTRLEGRRIFSEGRLVQNGVVTVEAEGEFAAIDRRRTLALAGEQARERLPATEETTRPAL